MKFALIVFFTAMVAIVSCQDGGDGAPPMTYDQLLALVKAEVGPDLCINMECRPNCVKAGNVNGYCDKVSNSCVCVPRPPVSS